MMSPKVDGFLAEMRADPVLAPMANQLAEAFRATDLEGDGNVHAIEFYRALEWIVSQPRTVREKIEKLSEFINLEDKVTIFSMKAWAGW